MEIKFLGHSSFRIKGKTASLVTDPFDPKMVGLKYSGVKADIVTVSHDHEDHNRYDLVKGVKKVISGPGEYEISQVSIIGLPSYHDDKKGEKRGKNTIYLIEMDFLRLVHLGDIGHKLTEATLETLGDIDILMVPVGGEFTISPQQAVEVVRSIEPKIILPMHYLMPGLNKEIFGKLENVKPFLNEIGLPFTKEEKLTIKGGLYQEEQKVVVLTRKTAPN
jgi:L-ascorbate metabolism protein UlaG (beta-lactamase superfamily)